MFPKGCWLLWTLACVLLTPIVSSDLTSYLLNTTLEKWRLEVTQKITQEVMEISSAEISLQVGHMKNRYAIHKRVVLQSEERIRDLETELDLLKETIQTQKYTVPAQCSCKDKESGNSIAVTKTIATTTTALPMTSFRGCEKQSMLLVAEFETGYFHFINMKTTDKRSMMVRKGTVGLAYHAGQNTVYMSNRLNEMILSLKDTGKILEVTSCLRCHDLAIDTKENILVFTEADDQRVSRSVTILNLERKTKKTVRQFPYKDKPTSLCLDPSRKKIFIAVRGQQAIHRMTYSGEIISSFPLGHTARDVENRISLTFDDRSDTLYYCVGDNVLRVRYTRKRNRQTTLPNVSNPADLLVVRGRLLVTHMDTAFVDVWETSRLRKKWTKIQSTSEFQSKQMCYLPACVK